MVKHANLDRLNVPQLKHTCEGQSHLHDTARPLGPGKSSDLGPYSMVTYSFHGRLVLASMFRLVHLLHLVHVNRQGGRGKTVILHGLIKEHASSLWRSFY